MKRLIGIILILITLLSINFKSYAYQGNGFVWNKTEIWVPINSSFNSYLSEFDVKFYYNGNLTNEEVKVELDKFYYGSATISTDVVENKNVTLYAYVPGYTNYCRMNVLVHIYDNECPTIRCVKSLDLNVGESFSPSEFFSITDNDEVNTKTIVYDYDTRDLDILGKHQITVSASDKSGNYAERTFTYSINDTKAPILSVASTIEVEYGDINFKIQYYVDAYDDYDGDLTNAVIYSNFDPYKLGEQTITISVSDAIGNTSEIKKNIKVVDLSAPILELCTYEDNISIEKLDSLDFKSYVSRIYDNCTELSMNDVIIDTSDYFYGIGLFEIQYTLFDSSKNYTKRTLIINVRSNEAPIIEASDLTFKKGEAFDLRDYINVSSSSDSNVSENYKIDELVLDRSTPGTYEVIIEAMDFSGNESKKSIFVTITNDDESPTKSTLDYIYTFIYEHKIVISIVVIVLFSFLFTKINSKRKKIGI